MEVASTQPSSCLKYTLDEFMNTEKIFFISLFLLLIYPLHSFAEHPDIHHQMIDMLSINLKVMQINIYNY